MSKAVLISIKPEWCELIANGNKTIEVRKTRPKLETPFKCYIYCTKEKEYNDVFWCSGVIGKMSDKSNGKVIGEFICDGIISHCEMANADIAEQQGCIKREQLFEYANGKELYGWHISNLVIYDKPRGINEFSKPCICEDEYEGETYCDCLHCDLAGDSDDGIVACNRKLTRPPQSWCYVEEV